MYWCVVEAVGVPPQAAARGGCGGSVSRSLTVRLSKLRGAPHA